MAAQGKASVIRRKTRAARDGADPRVISPVRALRLALARAADRLFNLALVVATVEQHRLDPGEIEATLGGEGLFVLLDGAGGARAAMRLDPALLSALIEVQTTGHVRPGDVRARVPTRTDAAMAAPLIDAMLEGFDAGMSEGASGAVPRGFHFGDRVEDARALTLLLTAPEFDFFRLTVDLGPGLRTGRLDIVLPCQPVPSSRERGQGKPGAGGGAAAPDDIATLALGAPVVLDAVMARITLPLSEAMALRVGQRLRLPRQSLGAIRLLATGGHLVAEARLGRSDGNRAVRLRGPAEPRDAAPAPVAAQAPRAQPQKPGGAGDSPVPALIATAETPPPPRAAQTEGTDPAPKTGVALAAASG